jgi:hypothetical protein
MISEKSAGQYYKSVTFRLRTGAYAFTGGHSRFTQEGIGILRLVVITLRSGGGHFVRSSIHDRTG